MQNIETHHDLTHTITVDRSPDQVFAAINDVRGWWTGDITGASEKLGDEFAYRYGDVHYSKQRVVESVPGQKVVWLVVDSKLSFIADKTEWNGTKVVFEIAKQGAKTQLRFTHVGLARGAQCFTDCFDAWGSYVNGSLRRLIETGDNH